MLENSGGSVGWLFYGLFSNILGKDMQAASFLECHQAILLFPGGAREACHGPTEKCP